MDWPPLVPLTVAVNVTVPPVVVEAVGGAIVTAAPHILYLKDTNGGGKADKREVLYEGFAAQNPQLRISHPILGVDNWIHAANGLRGGQVKRAGQADAQPINLTPSPMMVFTMHRDRPGVVASVAGVLAKHDINIATMSVARAAPRQESVMVLSIDDPIDSERVAVAHVIEERVEGCRQRGEPRAGHDSLRETYNSSDPSS